MFLISFFSPLLPNHQSPSTCFTGGVPTLNCRNAWFSWTWSSNSLASLRIEALQVDPCQSPVSDEVISWGKGDPKLGTSSGFPTVTSNMPAPKLQIKIPPKLGHDPTAHNRITTGYTSLTPVRGALRHGSQKVQSESKAWRARQQGAGAPVERYGKIILIGFAEWILTLLTPTHCFALDPLKELTCEAFRRCGGWLHSWRSSVIKRPWAQRGWRNFTNGTRTMERLGGEICNWCWQVELLDQKTNMQRGVAICRDDIGELNWLDCFHSFVGILFILAPWCNNGQQMFEKRKVPGWMASFYPWKAFPGAARSASRSLGRGQLGGDDRNSAVNHLDAS